MDRENTMSGPCRPPDATVRQLAGMKTVHAMLIFKVARKMSERHNRLPNRKNQAGMHKGYLKVVWTTGKGGHGYEDNHSKKRISSKSKKCAAADETTGD
jgi:hypothetical protein